MVSSAVGVKFKDISFYHENKEKRKEEKEEKKKRKGVRP
jgi:hypothetical protein